MSAEQDADAGQATPLCVVASIHGSQIWDGSFVVTAVNRVIVQESTGRSGEESPMRLKHDLRYEMSFVLLQAKALMHALSALPETEAAMEDALAALTPTERAQMARDIGELIPRFYQLHQHSLWLRHQLQGEAHQRAAHGPERVDAE